MSIDEGYVKYLSHWSEGDLPDADAVATLERWRAPLHAAGLIGHYEDLGIGYGNLSVRGKNRGQFTVSGTQTGHHRHTTARHYSQVTRVDIERNTVWCTGPVQASSEALTHAVLYRLSDAINAVVHVHDAELWIRYRDELPTTDENVAYGTPHMATEFERIWQSSSFRDEGLAIMGGHAEGIVSIGRDLAEAALRLLNLKSYPAPSSGSVTRT